MGTVSIKLKPISVSWHWHWQSPLGLHTQQGNLLFYSTRVYYTHVHVVQCAFPDHPYVPTFSRCFISLSLRVLTTASSVASVGGGGAGTLGGAWMVGERRCRQTLSKGHKYNSSTAHYCIDKTNVHAHVITADTYNRTITYRQRKTLKLSCRYKLVLRLHTSH